MNYYKIIVGTQIVGAVCSNDFRHVQAKHNILLACDEKIGQYVQFKETLYRDGWLVPVTSTLSYTPASVLVVDKQEYDMLIETFEENEEPIEYEEPVEEIPEPEIDEIENLTLEYVRAAKIAQLSKACETAINSGFDIVLHEESKHFTYSIQDQVNLQSAQLRILNGETSTPYHATGEEISYYPAEDIIAIINAGNLHKDENLAKFNSLKTYINALENKYTIAELTLESEVPAEYQNALLIDIAGNSYQPETLSEIPDNEELTEAFNILIGA